jgi:predicted RNase H-like nuclease (RuvC/YqgF family)
VSADALERLERRVRDLDDRVRACEQSIEQLRSSTGREATELRTSLQAVSRDLETLTVTLRDWRQDLDGWWRERWPSLEGRLSRIEATTEAVQQRVAQPAAPVTPVSHMDWRGLGLIAAVLFGGGLTVGGGGGGAIAAMLAQPQQQQSQPAQ